MLAIPAFQASTQPALIRANNKPPLEVVVANLELKKEATGEGDRHIFIKKMARGV